MRACSDWQVYILSAEARCTALALALHEEIILGDDFSPPSLPPVAPDVASPPPPPSPPRPGLPTAEARRVSYVHATRVLLSTFFLAEVGTDNATITDHTGNLMGVRSYSTSATRTATVVALPGDAYAWAQCDEALLGQRSLPCRSGDAPVRCVDGARPCGATAYDNMLAPSLEMDFSADVTTTDSYLFAVEFKLPEPEEYGRLLFEAVEANDGARGYELVLRDAHHVPLAVQCEPWTTQSVQGWTAGLRHVQHRCASVLATEDDYYELARPRYLTLTLPGAMRMIWLEDLVLQWRTIEEFPPRPPPSPDPPPAPPTAASPPFPPDPSPPPVASYTWYAGVDLAGTALQSNATLQEPCQLTRDACSHLLYEQRLRDARFQCFALTESGCCTLHTLTNTTAVVTNALAAAPVTRGGAAGVGVA